MQSVHVNMKKKFQSQSVPLVHTTGVFCTQLPYNHVNKESRLESDMPRAVDNVARCVSVNLYLHSYDAPFSVARLGTNLLWSKTRNKPLVEQDWEQTSCGARLGTNLLWRYSV